MGGLFCPGNRLWLPTIHAAKSGLPGLAVEAVHTLDPALCPLPASCSSQPRLLAVPSSLLHTLLFPPLLILGPSALVPIHPIVQGSSKNHLPSILGIKVKPSPPWNRTMLSYFLWLLSVLFWFFLPHSDRQPLRIIAFIVM